MPVILDPADWDRWLAPETARSDLRSLLFPFPAETLDLYEVSPAVNNVQNEGSELLEPVG
jgi:putative SOS response-associated peptidase YedK